MFMLRGSELLGVSKIRVYIYIYNKYNLKCIHYRYIDKIYDR